MLAYGVGQDYEKFWTRAKSTHHACIMPVFDTNDYPINPDHFINKLVGALCEVTFTLKHYAIGAQNKEGGQDASVEAHDIFSAQVETVAVIGPLLAQARLPPILAFISAIINNVAP